MRRRDFITLLGGTAATWPLAARTQPREQMKRIGILLPGTADNPVFQGRLAAFYQEWRYWAGASAAMCASIRTGRRPKLRSFANTRRNWRRSLPTSFWPLATSTVPPLLQATRTVPIVFPLAGDPVGAGFVDSLARPGGNATGFMHLRIRYGREMAGVAQRDRANVTRVAVLRDPASPSQTAQFGAIRAMAPSVSVEVIPINVRAASEIERAVTDFARSGEWRLIPSRALQRCVIAI